MEGSRNVLFEYSLNIAAKCSLNIPFERYWNVPQEHSENIALERSKHPDIFLVLGTFRWNLPNIPLVLQTLLEQEDNTTDRLTIVVTSANVN